VNTQEAAAVLFKVRAYRPTQEINDITVDAWQEAFDDIRFEDALLAVRNIGRVSSKYLDPAQIRTEVERLRAERKHAAHEDKCYICGGTWEQCSRRYSFEKRRSVPDPHQFESGLTSERDRVRMPGRIRHELTHLLDSKNLRNKGVA
jgi:hypothetical protein